MDYRKKHKKRPKPSPPNVRCGRLDHPDEPGYILCNHVKDGREPAANIVPPNPDEHSARGLGEITCGRQGHTVDELHLCCASCARTMGWIPQGNTKQ